MSNKVAARRPPGTFGDRLTRSRMRIRFPGSYVAKAIGINRGTYFRWEMNGSKPTWDQLRTVARFLEVPILWLMYGAGEGWKGEKDDARDRQHHQHEPRA